MIDKHQTGRITVLGALFSLVAMIVSAADHEPLSEEQPAEMSPSLSQGEYLWLPSILAPDEVICVDPSQTNCALGCPDYGSQSTVCAEFTFMVDGSGTGFVTETCCINELAIGSRNPDECIWQAEIVRQDGSTPE